jgi:centrosomal CEP192-like protein/ASPM-SPD-2-Hydin domain-containing protein
MPSRCSLFRTAVNVLLLPVLQVVHPGPIFSQPSGSSAPHLPVVFEPNRGQAEQRTLFIAHTADGTVGLQPDGVLIHQRTSDGGQSFVLKFHGSREAKIEEERGGDGTSNHYFGGAVPRKIEHIPLYRRIRYAGIYPGIDAIFHGNQGKLEYDFEISPGADPQQLRLDLAGSQTATVNADGSLEIALNKHRIRLLRPQAFQANGADRTSVEVAYTLIGSHEIGFKLHGYDPGKELVIDPVVSYAEIIGSNNSTNLRALASDSDGNLIVAGDTYASDFPVVNGDPISQMASSSVIIAKFDPTGESILYSTYIDAAGSNSAGAIAIDHSDSVYVVGGTSDRNFPVTSHELGACSNDFCNSGFVAKFDSTGAMIYSTLVGVGIGPQAITVDPDGNAIIGGLAAAGFMQTVNAYQAAYLGGSCTSCYSAFFAKLNAQGNGFIFSSYFGTGNIATALAQDSEGNIYIAGTATNVYGPTVPLKGELQASSGPFFLTKFAPDGKSLLFSTFFGGYVFPNEIDSIAGMKVGSDGTVYIGGNVLAVGFPYTLNAYHYPIGTPGNGRMFATAFDSSLTKLKYSTDLGGGRMTGMTVDGSGNFYAAADSVTDPLPLKNAVVADGSGNGFFMELNPLGQPLQVSEFGGHFITEHPTAIDVDANGDIYLTGALDNANYPPSPGCASDPVIVGSNYYAGPLHSSCMGQNGVFVAKIAPGSRPQISLTDSLPFLQLRNVGSADLNISSITLSGNLAKTGGTCGKTVPAGASCILTLADSDGKAAQGSVTINSNADPASQTFTPQLPDTFSGTVGDYLFVDLSQVHFNPQFAGTKGASVPVRISNGGLADMTLNGVYATPLLTETNDCPGILPPGTSCTVQLAFDASLVYRSNTLSISYDNNPPTDYLLSGPYVASPTALMLSQSNPIPVGNETQGNPYLDRTVTVTNVSNSLVAAPQVTVSGDVAFTLDGNTCSGSLTPQQSCIVQFGMNSSAPVGQHNATLNFSGSLSASVDIWGIVNAPHRITPSTYQMVWTPVLLGASSAQDLTLTNSTSSSAAISGFSFISADYSQTNNCGAGLAAGASCTVHVTFTPQATGQRNDSMAIDLGSNATPLLISLTGKGSATLGLTPATLDFGSENMVGATSAPHLVTLANNTSSAASYTLVVTPPFAATTTCGNPLPAHSSCSLSVVYKPTAVATDSGTLSVTPTGASSGTSVLLFGGSVSGSEMSVTASFHFPDTEVGKSSPGTITISNSGKLGIANIAFSISGPDSTRFTYPANQCSSIAAGGSCTLPLTFSPTRPGDFYAGISISSNAANSPRIVSLTGTGVTVQPAAALSVTSLDFGNQDQGTKSPASIVTLTNSSTVALTISGISSSADFPATNTCGSSLAPSASCQISVTFLPSKTGPVTGALTITDNAASGNQIVTLNGNGTAPTIALSTGSGGSLSSTVAKGTTASYSLSLAASPGFSGTATLTCSGAPQYATCTPSPSTIALTNAATVPFTVSVVTQSTTASAALRDAGLFSGAGILALCLLVPRRLRGRLFAIACVALVIGTLSACGGGSNGSGGGSHQPTVNYTPSGTYQLTLTATSGSNKTTQTLTLTVQ